MEVVIRTYNALPCSTEVFTINGINADVDDFGEMDNDLSYGYGGYGCGNMRFVPSYGIDECVLEKYGITHEEAEQVQDMLDCKMDVGSCGLCI